MWQCSLARELPCERQFLFPQSSFTLTSGNGYTPSLSDQFCQNYAIVSFLKCISNRKTLNVTYHSSYPPIHHHLRYNTGNQNR
ncbi:hypothetical protein Hanom_Chr13g01224461 [Helianthus anomalus]